MLITVNKKIYDLNSFKLNHVDFRDWHSVEGQFIRSLSMDKTLANNIIQYIIKNIDDILEGQDFPAGTYLAKQYFLAELNKCLTSKYGADYFAIQILTEYWNLFLPVINQGIDYAVPNISYDKNLQL